MKPNPHIAVLFKWIKVADYRKLLYNLSGNDLQKTRILLIFAVTVSCAAFIVSAGFTQSGSEKALSSNPCQVPDKFLQSGHTDEAQKLYSTLLQSQRAEDVACAVDGLKKIPSDAEKEYSIGATFEKSGDLKQAQEHYLEAIKKGSASQKSIDAYMRLRKEVDPLAAVRILDSIGEEDKARDAYLAILKDDPSIGLPQELEHLSEQGASTGWLGFWKRTKREVGAAVSSSVIGIIKVLCVVLLVAAALAVWIVCKRPSLDIGDFKAGKDKEMDAATFVAHLEERYHHHTEGTKKNNPNFVSGHVSSIELPADLAFPTQVSWLKPIMSYLQKIVLLGSSLELKGLLDQPDGRPLRAVLQLTRGNKIISTIGLKQEDYFAVPEKKDSEITPIFMLAEVAALWLLFELHNPKNWSRLDKVKNWGRKEKELDLLGTKQWSSYALFRAGQYAQLAGNSNAAKGFYVKALEEDNTFRSARVNLARLLWNDGDRMKNEVLKDVALKHFNTTISDIRQKSTTSPSEIYADPSTYAALFQNAIYLYRGGSTEKAIEITELLKTMIEAAPKKVRKMSREFEHYLGSLVAPALAMNRGLRVLFNNDPNARNEMADAEDGNILNVSCVLHHDLACAYSVCAEKTCESHEDCVIKALEHLEIALWLASDDKIRALIIDDAKTDRSMECIRTSPKFLDLLSKYALADLQIVGVKYAQELARKCGIYSIKDLLQNTSRPSLRQGIAAELDVSEVLVERWHRVAGLAQIKGIGIKEANLLDLAGVHSTDHLAREDANKLLLLLQNFDKLACGTISCTLDSITGWIKEAQHLTATPAH
jgi:tetratricopeptide (TPR) repeat protein